MTWWKALLIGGSISVTIESLQFFFMRGFSELDDVMHNTLGCILGYILVKGSRQLVKG
jgi:glycopeptide antibiotics resistance protein